MRYSTEPNDLKDRKDKTDKVANMPVNNMDILALKIVMYLPKVIAAVMGAVFSLVLSGDIGEDGKIKINISVIIKFSIAVTISLFGGEAFIELMEYQEYSVMTHGAIMLFFAVFGMLIVGIGYQSIELMKGKPPSVIIKEIKESLISILK